MAGIRSSYENATFLTNKVVYRSGITAADDYSDRTVWATPGTRWNNDDFIPMIRPDVNTSNFVGGVNQPSGAYGKMASGVHGYDAWVELYVSFIREAGITWDEDPTYDAGTMASIQCFAWGGPTGAALGEPEDGNDHYWYLVGTHVIPCNRLIRMFNIPAVPYIVLVNNMPDNSTLDIIEQHSE